MQPELGVHLWDGDLAELARQAVRMESLGFASVTVGDHLRRSASAPLISCAAIASATDRVRFGPLVLNNDLRHPVVVAREAAALGVPAEVATDSPYVLVGSAREIADRLRELHELLGIVRWTVFGNRSDLQPADAFVPVLELLAEA
jgi:alkanesulfonate monooxygenase SsuD/methylene tetrahydromethanopterin reductase-like flavin-dependent oxidoreductase (luciferase family)